MEQKKKVYIRGCKGRGDEVIKMLTDLGASNRHGYLDGNNSEYVYFIDHNDNISIACYDSECGKILKDNYTEIELPPQKWKDGDILFNEADNEFAVFESECIINSISTGKFLSYLVTFNGDYLSYQTILEKDFRFATKSEIIQFHERLHSIDKDWDAEHKKLVDWRWKPKKEEKYWYVSSTGEVLSIFWNDGIIANQHYELGNVFHTYKQAEVMAEKIKQLFKEAKK